MGCVIAELFMEGKALFDLSNVSPLMFSRCSPYMCVTLIDALLIQILLRSYCHTEEESMIRQIFYLRWLHTP